MVFHQPIWNICSSYWIISLVRGENKTYLGCHHLKNHNVWMVFKWFSRCFFPTRLTFRFTSPGPFQWCISPNLGFSSPNLGFFTKPGIFLPTKSLGVWGGKLLHLIHYHHTKLEGKDPWKSRDFERGFVLQLGEFTNKPWDLIEWD